MDHCDAPIRSVVAEQFCAAVAAIPRAAKWQELDPGMEATATQNYSATTLLDDSVPHSREYLRQMLDRALLELERAPSVEALIATSLFAGPAAFVFEQKALGDTLDRIRRSGGTLDAPLLLHLRTLMDMHHDRCSRYARATPRQIVFLNVIALCSWPSCTTSSCASNLARQTTPPSERVRAL